MGSSVGRRLGSGADYSGCRRAALASHDQSAQSQARPRNVKARSVSLQRCIASGGLRPPCSGRTRPKTSTCRSFARSLQVSSLTSKTYLKSNHLNGGRIRGAPEGFETAIIESTSACGYGEGATLIMGVVAPVITAVLAVPRSKFFNVKALMAVEIGSLAVALINLT